MEKKYTIYETKNVVVRQKTNVSREVSFDEFIAHRLKTCRLDDGMSQKQLAEKLGLSRVSVCNIESGKHGVNISTLKKYSDIFNLTSEEILGF